ncbi:gamma-type small acid-soluble spore protein [Brevibacillus ruminantium]|uniref:Small, acid-soluble spore protein gamma-type n=1 Tax=Brevibacillus ruminantium TaxID=2950604 RepID=A0ABY4WHJ6_9BACL|nr:gamma-type small acid-soluble spore protein [Brevibacillus ruminantium]USG66339.1 gamma-type small acid-soluble spore protein [Brevibacillus ruminantium]
MPKKNNPAAMNQAMQNQAMQNQTATNATEFASETNVSEVRRQNQQSAAKAAQKAPVQGQQPTE